MKKYLAFDIGLQHTGVAGNADSLAFPLSTIEADTYDKLLTKIINLVEDYEPESLVFGFPDRGPVKVRVLRLTRDLTEEFGLPIDVIDETKSTKYTQKILKETGMSAAKRKQTEHASVATILLQEYLDNLLD